MKLGAQGIVSNYLDWIASYPLRQTPLLKLGKSVPREIALRVWSTAGPVRHMQLDILRLMTPSRFLQIPAVGRRGRISRPDGKQGESSDTLRYLPAEITN